MNDIVIPEFTISNVGLFGVFLTFILLLMFILVISNRWDKITPHITEANIFFWSVGILATMLFLPAILQLLQILWHPQANGLLEGDSKGYAVLLAAIVGAPLVVWRTVVAHMQSNTAAQGLITDRITKAVEQLGAEKSIQNIQDKITNQSSTTPIFNHVFNSGFNQGNDQKFQINDERYYSVTKSVPNLEVRLGGIYALERIARDSLDDHITVMEILCAYVRNNSPLNRNRIPINWAEAESGTLNNWRASVRSVRFDIQAIIDVIARRNQEQINREIFEEYNWILVTVIFKELISEKEILTAR